MTRPDPRDFDNLLTRPDPTRDILKRDIFKRDGPTRPDPRDFETPMTGEKPCFQAYLRRRSDCAAGAPGYGVSRGVLGRFGYMIASIIALHHAKPAVTESRQSRVSVVNNPRCRK